MYGAQVEDGKKCRANRGNKLNAVAFYTNCCNVRMGEVACREGGLTRRWSIMSR